MTEDEKDLLRFEWLVENVLEEYVRPGVAGDCRLKYKLPEILSFNCMGVPISFREAIDIKMGIYEVEE